MPVTARLSQAFYERLGEQVTNELVRWFNDVDTTYRNDLKDLNELNFARFDAKVEQRFAQHEAKWETRFAAMDAKWEGRFAAMDAKWETRFAELELKMEKRFADFEVKMEKRFADFEVKIEQSLAAQTRWMYLAWAVQIVAILSLWAKK
ncbi:hypothetical protein EBR44_03985 [bacterium]|nr:hypothetical protein [bacterium]